MACSKYKLINPSGSNVYFNYKKCSDVSYQNQTLLSPGQEKNIWLIDDTYVNAFNNSNVEVIDEGIWPPAPTTPSYSFTISSSRVENEGSFGGTFTGVTTSGYTLTDNQNNELWPAYYFDINNDDSDITNIFLNYGMSLSYQGYMFNVTWGPGSTSSTLAKVSYNTGNTQMNIIAVDPADTDYQIDNSIQGTALEGTFNFPATFTPYLPITDKNSWC